MDRDDTTEVNPARVDQAVSNLHRRAEALIREIDRVRSLGVIVHVGTTHRTGCDPMILVSAGGRRTPTERG